jgi:ribosomal protein S18 acetylase RimI-like enzyme
MSRRLQEPQIPVAIEAMTIADYDPARALLSSIEGVRMRSTDSHEATERYLLRNPGLSFVARSGDKIVGCVMCGHDGRRGYLHHLAVEPGFRRQGIGSVLVSRCIAALEQLGIQKTHIEVLTENTLGHQYWTSQGWQRRTDIVQYSFSSSEDPNV